MRPDAVGHRGVLADAAREDQRVEAAEHRGDRPVRTLRTDEELMIAHHTGAAVAAARRSKETP